MKIRLGRRNRGATVLLVVIVLTLAIVLIASMFILAIRAVKKIKVYNDTGGVDTNELAAVWYTENPEFIIDTLIIRERIEESTNLYDWMPVGDVVLPDYMPMDFNPPVDKTKPMEFFRITVYGTNQ